MTDDNNSSIKCGRDRSGMKKHGGSGMVGFGYFMAFIAAAVYFIQQATSFGMGVLGFLKALVWPYFLIYNLMEFLKM
ncbi:hypothetical protein ES705_00057 [subsurface metagenome]